MAKNALIKIQLFYTNQEQIKAVYENLQGDLFLSELSLYLCLERINLIFGFSAVQNLRKDTFIFKITNFDKRLAKFVNFDPKNGKILLPNFSKT